MISFAGVQHLEQSLLEESAREEAEELQRLEQEDIDAIISSMLDEQGASHACCLAYADLAIQDCMHTCHFSNFCGSCTCTENQGQCGPAGRSFCLCLEGKRACAPVNRCPGWPDAPLEFCHVL